MGAQVDTGQRDGVRYFSVNGGRFQHASQEGEEGAVRRDWELQTGETGTKWEIPYKYLEGILQNVEFEDAKFGEQVMITLVDGDETMVARVNSDSRFFSDLAKKLPNIDLTQPVKLAPYDFISKKKGVGYGKSVKGMTVTQDDEKIYSYYYDIDKKETINGLPDVSEEERADYDKDDWKIFFMQERKFLKKAVQAIQFPEVENSSEGGAPASKKETVADEPPAKEKSAKKATIKEPVSDDSDDLPF